MIDTVATDVTEVVPLVREEEVVDHLLSGLLVHRVLAAELAVDMVDRLLLRVGGVLLQRIGDDTIVESGLRLSLEEHRLGRILEVKDRLDILLRKLFISIDHYIVALHGDYFTRFLIHEVLYPRIEDTCSYLTTDIFLQVGLIHLHLLGDAEETQDILISLVADGSQQSGHGQLLLAIDVGVHDVIDVCRKLDPRSLKGNDTGVEELGAVVVHAHREEYSRGAVHLRHHHSLSAVDNKATCRRHIGDLPQVDVLNRSIKVLMLRICTIQLELRLERDSIREPPAQTLLNGVPGRIHEVIQKLEDEVISRVGDWKVFQECLVQSLALPLTGRHIQLHEVLVRLELNVEKVREG